MKIINILFYLSLLHAPPSPPSGEVALIYPHTSDYFDIPLSSSTILNYNKNFILDSSQLSKVNERTATLKGDETIWSNTIPLKNTNYIEATFRIIDEYEPNQYHSGIVWNDGYKDYYLFLRSNEISIYTLEKGIFKSAPIEDLTKDEWSTLKVVYVNGMINIFLNTTLKLQIPNISTNIHISKVGIKKFQYYCRI